MLTPRRFPPLIIHFNLLLELDSQVEDLHKFNMSLESALQDALELAFQDAALESAFQQQWVGA